MKKKYLAHDTLLKDESILNSTLGWSNQKISESKFSNQMSFLSGKNVPNQVNSKNTWLKRARTLLKDRSVESFFQSPQENVCECTLHSQQYQSVKLHTEKGKKNYGGMFENIWKASNRTANTTDIVAPLYVSFL